MRLVDIYPFIMLELQARVSGRTLNFGVMLMVGGMYRLRICEEVNMVGVILRETAWHMNHIEGCHDDAKQSLRVLYVVLLFQHAFSHRTSRRLYNLCSALH